MKAKLISYLLAVVVLASCHHGDVYDPNASKGNKVTDLVIPKGFDWEMSGNVKVSVSAKVETVASIYDDAECRNLIATLAVSPEVCSYNLELAKGTEQLFVQYPVAQGNTKVVAVPLKITKSAEMEIKLPEDAAGNSDKEHQGIIYYPSKGKWGSIFFEDMWPRLGDYDFNDVAVWYSIQLYLTGKKSDRVEAIGVQVQLNALGGLYPYQLGLQIG